MRRSSKVGIAIAIPTLTAAALTGCTSSATGGGSGGSGGSSSDCGYSWNPCQNAGTNGIDQGGPQAAQDHQNQPGGPTPVVQADQAAVANHTKSSLCDDELYPQPTGLRVVHRNGGVYIAGEVDIKCHTALSVFNLSLIITRLDDGKNFPGGSSQIPGRGYTPYVAYAPCEFGTYAVSYIADVRGADGTRSPLGNLGSSQAFMTNDCR